MSCYASSSSIAGYVDNKIAPRLAKLKAELREEFQSAGKRQQQQLDRVEGKIDRLLALLEDQHIAKPLAGDGAKASTKVRSAS